MACETSLPAPIEYLPFTDGPFRMAMGLLDLKAEHWIELDARLPDQLALKEKLLRERHAEVFAARAGTETGGQETLELLAGHLAAHFPQVYARDGTRMLNHITQEALDLDSRARHPLEIAARLVQEDLCLMAARADAFELSAACVCFPSRWKLSEKLGQPLRGIHAPVPFYDEKIGAATDRFMQLLSEEKPVWRLNWTLHDSPYLFAPSAAIQHANAAGEAAAAPAPALWLRVERQTLRRLPRCREILFTIRTYVQPLADFTTRPDVRARLAAAIRGLPPQTAQYKSMAPLAADALAWLEHGR